MSLDFVNVPLLVRYNIKSVALHRLDGFFLNCWIIPKYGIDSAWWSSVKGINSRSQNAGRSQTEKLRCVNKVSSSASAQLSLSSFGEMATTVKLNTGAQMPNVGLGTWKVRFCFFFPLSLAFKLADHVCGANVRWDRVTAMMRLNCF